MMLFWVLFFLFSFQLVVAIWLRLKFKQTEALPLGNGLHEITFIIPFHNEENRISPLIQSLNAVDFPPNYHLLFIDDYSTDKTVNLIHQELNQPFKIIKNNKTKGKKNAIKRGVLESTTEIVITWDADIKFDVEYFDQLKKLPQADMVILPVEMETNNVWQKWAAIEFSFLKILTFSGVKMRTPELCYGANLMFKRSTFLKVDELRDDYHIPSGDDVFLLRAFRSNNYEINGFSTPSLNVNTQAPKTILEVWQQRRRWAGKTSKMKSLSTILFGMLLIFVQLGMVITTIAAIKSPVFLILIGLKFAAEAISVSYFLRQNPVNWLVLILHQFTYPLYLILLLFKPPAEKKWADKINNHNAVSDSDKA